jgi:hypothetical protein
MDWAQLPEQTAAGSRHFPETVFHFVCGSKKSKKRSPEHAGTGMMAALGIRGRAPLD